MAPSAVETLTTSDLTSKGVTKALKPLTEPLSKKINGPVLAELNASKLTTTSTTNPRAIPAPGAANATKS